MLRFFRSLWHKSDTVITVRGATEELNIVRGEPDLPSNVQPGDMLILVIDGGETKAWTIGENGERIPIARLD